MSLLQPNLKIEPAKSLQQCSKFEEKFNKGTDKYFWVFLDRFSICIQILKLVEANILFRKFKGRFFKVRYLPGLMFRKFCSSLKHLCIASSIVIAVSKQKFSWNESMKKMMNFFRVTVFNFNL